MQSNYFDVSINVVYFNAESDNSSSSSNGNSSNNYNQLIIMITMRQRTVPQFLLPQLLWEPSQLLNRVSVRLISSCQLSLSSGCSPVSPLPTPSPLCGDCCVCPCQCKKSEHNVLPGIFIGLTTPWRLQGNHEMQKAHSQSSALSPSCPCSSSCWPTLHK